MKLFTIKIDKILKHRTIVKQKPKIQGNKKVYSRKAKGWKRDI